VSDEVGKAHESPVRANPLTQAVQTSFDVHAEHYDSHLAQLESLLSNQPLVQGKHDSSLHFSHDPFFCMVYPTSQKLQETKPKLYEQSMHPVGQFIH
jgi:hypothetical protein